MIDTNSPTWLVIKRWAHAEIETIVAKITMHGTSIEETEFLRGRMLGLHELLLKGEEKPPLVQDPNEIFDGY